MRVGIDVGGSGVRAAMVDDTGQIGEVARVVPASIEVDDLVAAVVAAARQVAPVGQPWRVGAGVPGYVRDGVVLGSPNLPALGGVPLAARLERELGVPARIENDANAAALGAYDELGGHGVWLVLTLGTGVGGGVVAHGVPYQGGAIPGGELGHIYVGGERVCGCGGVGCLETWCSNTGLTGAAREAELGELDGRGIVEAARAGDPRAVEIVDAAAAALGRGLVSLVNAFGPDRVLVLGGLAAAGDLLAPAAVGWLRERAVEPLRAVPVVFGDRADHHAIRGAAALWPVARTASGSPVR